MHLLVLLIFSLGSMLHATPSKQFADFDFQLVLKEKLGLDYSLHKTESISEKQTEKLKNNPKLYQYFVMRENILSFYDESNYAQATKLCQSNLISRKDFLIRLRCLASGEGFIPFKQLITDIELLISDAKLAGDEFTVAEAYSDLGWYQSSIGDISSAFNSYTESLRLIDSQKYEDSYYIRINAASLYIDHGNEAYIRKGIAIIEELMDHMKKADEANHPKITKEPNFLMYEAAYNLAGGYMILEENTKALELFEFSANYRPWRQLSLVLAAYSAASLGKFDLAKRYLQDIGSLKEQSSMDMAYIRCHIELTRKFWQKSQTLDSCFEFPTDTPYSTLAGVYTEVIKSSDERYELQALREFYKIYKGSIEPQLKNRSTREASLVEVSRLELEVQFRDEKIALGKRIEQLLYILAAASTFLLLAFVAVVISRKAIIKKSKIIRKQAKTIKRVIDSIDQGILLLESNLTFSRQKSSMIHKLLPELDSIENVTLFHLANAMGLSADDGDKFVNSLKTAIGMEELQWEVNLNHLPEILIKESSNQTLEFEWNPVYEDTGELSQVVIVIRDISHRLELESELYIQNRKNSIALNMLRIFKEDANTLKQFFSNVTEKIEEMKSWLKDIDRNYDKLFQALHSMKGNCRSLKMNDLADLIHSAESALKEDDRPEGALEVKIEKVQEHLQLCRDVFESMFSTEEIQLCSQHDILSAQLSAISGTMAHLDRHDLKISSLKIKNDLHQLTSEESSDIADIINHSISNAIDHGYIRPIQIGKKNLKGIDLDISVIDRDETIEVMISDQGQGLDIEKIQEICELKGFKPKPNQSQYDVLFENEVSTAVNVTKTSGRGVGTSIIKAIADSHQGIAKIYPNKPSGTTILVSFPRKKSTDEAS